MYVSANHNRIYDNGALLAELYSKPRPKIFVGDPTVLGVHFEAELFSSQQYIWHWRDAILLAPSTIDDELKALYQALSGHVVPASVLVSIEDAVVCDSIVHCGVGSGFMPVYETHRPNDRPAVLLPTVKQLANSKVADFVRADTDYLFVGSAGSTNYGHYLVDDLPRLCAAEWMLGRSPARPICIVFTRFGTSMDAIRIESVRQMFGDRVSVAMVEPDRAVAFPQLFYPSPVSAHPTQKLPAAMNFVAQMGKRHRHFSHDRLFVGRMPEHSRILVNEVAVRVLLDNYGFRYVLPDMMSFTEQVKLFADASYVIGVMGAAMTNTIFSPAQSNIVYLAPDGWIEPFYFDLATTRNQSYSVLFGKIERPASPPHQSAFSIDIDVLREYLDRVVAPDDKITSDI